MEIQHVNVKIFVENPDAVDLEAFLGIFNHWIQQRVAPELLIDVADYRHVHAGPGVVLIGHEANFSMDNTGNCLGLLFNRKARLDGTNQARLMQAMRAALSACQQLEKENGLKFNGQEVQVTINDRLLAPNTRESFQALEAELQPVCAKLYGGAKLTIERDGTDSRDRLTANIKAETPFAVETLLKNLRETEYA
jgi:hypothetical protein